MAGRVAVHVAGLEDELGLLKQLDHPNIVRYLVRVLSVQFVTLLQTAYAPQHCQIPGESLQRLSSLLCSL